MAKKKKLKKVKPIEMIEDKIIFRIADAANDDWLRSARLLKKAKQGEKEAADELAKLFNTPLYEEDE